MRQYVEINLKAGRTDEQTGRKYRSKGILAGLTDGLDRWNGWKNKIN